MTSSASRHSDFIGRQQELATLATALEDTVSGRGRLVMLAGEPGIGKTRLARELTSLANARGAAVDVGSPIRDGMPSGLIGAPRGRLLEGIIGRAVGGTL